MGALRRMLVPLLLGVAAALMVWMSTSLYGVGMTTVSGDYVAAARSLAAGHGFVQYDGQPYIEYPPFYPMALAAFKVFGIDPQDAARVFNTLCLGVLVLLAAGWLQRNLRSGLVATLGGLAVLVSLPLLTMSVSAFPETPFMLLAVLALLAATRYARTGSRGAYVRAVVFTALCVLTRYMGVTVVFVGALVMITREARGVTERVVRALTFSIFAMIPTLMWLMRNVAVSGSVAGDRGPSDFTLAQNVWYMLQVISLWLLPERVPTVMRVGAVVVIAAAAVVWVLAGSRVRPVDEGAGESGETERRSEAMRGDSATLLLFAVVFVASTVVALSVVALDRMNTRYLIPAYVPGLLVILATADAVYVRLRRHSIGRVVALLLVVAMAGWVLLNARYEMRKVSDLGRRGAGGYSTRAWHNAATIAALQSRSPQGLVFANDAYAVHILTGIVALPSPRKYKFNSTTAVTEDLDRFSAVVDSAGAVDLVWFDAVHRDYLFDERELAGQFTLETVDSTTDGRIYRVTP